MSSRLNGTLVISYIILLILIMKNQSEGKTILSMFMPISTT